MFARGARSFAASSRMGWRAYTHGTAQGSRGSRAFIKAGKASGAIAALVGGGLVFSSPLSADSAAATTAPCSSLEAASTLDLLRTYLVYTLCTFPILIDNSASILHALTHSPIPGLKAVTEEIIRHTFFAQFVAGEDVTGCTEVMLALRKRNVGAMLNYSAEAEEEEASARGGHDDASNVELGRLKEVERALDALGEFEKKVVEAGGQPGATSFALKISGLIEPDVLHRASTALLRLRAKHTTTKSALSVKYPGAPTDADAEIVSRNLGDLVDQDLFDLRGSLHEMGVLSSDPQLDKDDLTKLSILWGKLRFLTERAKKNGIKLFIDAEHSWYQPCLDAYTLLLSSEFNRPSEGSTWNGPVIYGTYQSYLTRQPQLLAYAIEHAEKNGYALGVKLVRGAYFVQEREKWKKEGRAGADPIWPTKPATDDSFHGSVSTLLSTLARQLSGSSPELALTVLFGTHNDDSVARIIAGLRETGLASMGESGLLKMRDDARGKIFVAQLYGMKDDLMDMVTGTFEPSPMPIAVKYIAYGKLSEVMPFLGRRAIENKSLMSGEAGAGAEKRRVGAELRRRYWN